MTKCFHSLCFYYHYRRISVFISTALFTSDVLPGTVANSAPYQFFADSNLTLYQDLKTYMETQSTLVDDSKEGLNKARIPDEYLVIYCVRSHLNSFSFSSSMSSNIFLFVSFVSIFVQSIDGICRPLINH